ncbi:hypothetical protein DMC30DRAFT_402267 [Rhodotorula diobovata]|uniref:Uncharacterized protein n=1 Tax=Rhodotorula diobovata TaxID=5288 RepID=A0A5C5FPF5_9BASI|nr:hypothetical protein DMC30DRAFT_402267 [Rhodotorula diobovata]
MESRHSTKRPRQVSTPASDPRPAPHHLHAAARPGLDGDQHRSSSQEALDALLLSLGQDPPESTTPRETSEHPLQPLPRLDPVFCPSPLYSPLTRPLPTAMDVQQDHHSAYPPAQQAPYQPEPSPFPADPAPSPASRGGAFDGHAALPGGMQGHAEQPVRPHSLSLLTSCAAQPSARLASRCLRQRED